MTKEISKEVIAKIFALYYGYPVGAMIEAIHPYGETPEETVRGWLTGFNGEYGVEFAIIEEGGHTSEDPAYQDYDKVQLILSDRSDISDEDAVEVAKMARYSGEFKLEMGKSLIADYMRSSRCNVYPEYWIAIIDFLRSRGYMLPAFGITDLFEAGIAVRKETIKK